MVFNKCLPLCKKTATSLGKPPGPDCRGRSRKAAVQADLISPNLSEEGVAQGQHRPSVAWWPGEHGCLVVPGVSLSSPFSGTAASVVRAPPLPMTPRTPPPGASHNGRCLQGQHSPHPFSSVAQKPHCTSKAGWGHGVGAHALGAPLLLPPAKSICIKIAILLSLKRAQRKSEVGHSRGQEG